MKSIFAVAALVCAAGAAFADNLDPVAINANLSGGMVTTLDGLVSLRGYSSRNNIVTNDTYGAAIIGQSTTGAAFVTNAGRVTTFTFDGAASGHGTLVGSNAQVNVTESFTQTGPTTYRAVVSAFTADSSDLWVTGLTIGGNPMTQGRFDVGAGAFTNGLLWDNLPDSIQSLVITSVVLADGLPLATSTPLANGRVLPEMGSVVVWNGVVGSGVDEIQMVFDITVPTPASLALLGLGGLVATRRRR